MSISIKSELSSPRLSEINPSSEFHFDDDNYLWGEFDSLRQAYKQDCWDKLNNITHPVKDDIQINGAPLVQGKSAAEKAYILLENSKKIHPTLNDRDEQIRKKYPAIAVYGNLIFRKHGGFSLDAIPEKFIQEALTGYAKTDIGRFLLSRATSNEIGPVEIYIGDDMAIALAEKQETIEMQNRYRIEPENCMAIWRKECFEDCKKLFTKKTEGIFGAKKEYKDEIFNQLIIEIQTGNEKNANKILSTFLPEGDSLKKDIVALLFERFEQFKKMPISIMSKKDFEGVNLAFNLIKNTNSISGKIEFYMSTGSKFLKHNGEIGYLFPGDQLFHELTHALIPNKFGENERDFSLLKKYFSYSQVNKVIIDTDFNGIQDPDEFSSLIRKKYNPDDIPKIDFNQTGRGKPGEITATFFEQIFQQQYLAAVGSAIEKKFAGRDYYTEPNKLEFFRSPCFINSKDH